MSDFVGLPWVGGKISKRKWLLPLLDIGKPVGSYIEPFFGGGSVLFNRSAARLELCNDADGQVINFWREVQKNAAAVKRASDLILCHPQEYQEARRIYAEGETGVRAAAYFLFNLMISFGQNINGAYGMNRANDTVGRWRQRCNGLMLAMERMRHVQFTQDDVIFYLSKFYRGIENMQRVSPILLYADPPYLESMGDSTYGAKMPLASHEKMLSILLDFAKIKGWHIAVSNYANPLYDEALKGWRRDELTTHSKLSSAKGVLPRTEVLWRNWDVYAFL